MLARSGVAGAKRALLRREAGHALRPSLAAAAGSECSRGPSPPAPLLQPAASRGLLTSARAATSSSRSQHLAHCAVSASGCALCDLRVRRFLSVASNERDRDEHEQQRQQLTELEQLEALEEQYLERLHASEQAANAGQVALDTFRELQRTGGRGLSVELASTLIATLSAKRFVNESLEVLVYSREQGVRPRIHAYSAAIASCYHDEQYSHALRVFEVMRNDGYVPQTVTYSRALSAALKSDLHELVLEIFDDMLKNRVEMTIVIYNNILNSCARVGDAQSALGVLRAIRQREIAMTQSTFHSLAICAGKTGRWELALDVFASMQKAGFKPTATIYNSVFSACAKGKHWDDIVRVYETMPDELKPELRGLYLGAVVMGYAKAPSQELKLRGLAIFDEAKARGDQINFFAHNAALTAMLESGQLERVHAFAKDMKRQGLKWNTVTYQNVILAYIRGGAVDTAVQLLHANAKRMGKSTNCYRELIHLYADKRKDPREACRLTMQMMQNNARLSRLDWHNALRHALQLNERAPYWNFRKWMKIRAPTIIDEVPKELMLPDFAEQHKKLREEAEARKKAPNQPKFL